MQSPLCLDTYSGLMVTQGPSIPSQMCPEAICADLPLQGNASSSSLSCLKSTAFRGNSSSTLSSNQLWPDASTKCLEFLLKAKARVCFLEGYPQGHSCQSVCLPVCPNGTCTMSSDCQVYGGSNSPDSKMQFKYPEMSSTRTTEKLLVVRKKPTSLRNLRNWFPSA